jgi:sugar (pentulose or hexulose) kinase
MADAGSAPESWLASGNGLASPLWRSIVADTLGQPLGYVAAPERSGVGAALIAGIGTGIYSDYQEAATVADRPITSTEPDATRLLSYDTVYARYQRRSTALLAGQSATTTD